uniref:Integrase core domain-containing protein n=1 Tax=Branchiostoma floridae TaxID=7739 RepID=C3ZZA9_BRAFL|eukprot:XP_002586102.1 hypothetical protein BRAFLDRAFT_110004 [Branchiostoma floridae]
MTWASKEVVLNGVRLSKYKCRRGSNSLEGLHSHLYNAVPSQRCGIMPFQVYLISFAVQWNSQMDSLRVAGGQGHQTTCIDARQVQLMNQQQEITKFQLPAVSSDWGGDLSTRIVPAALTGFVVPDIKESRLQELSVFVMGDFNGRVGRRRDPWTAYLGPHSDRSTECNYNGHQLLSLCAEYDLVITNTLFQHRSSHTQTWYRWSDMTVSSQIDFILTRASRRTSVQDARAIPNAGLDTDHRPVLMYMRGKGNGSHRRKLPHEPQINTHKLRKNMDIQEEIKQRVTERLKQEDTWDKSAEETWSIFKNTLLDCLMSKCGKKKNGRGQRKATKWWNDEVKEAVREKKRLYKYWSMKTCDGDPDLLRSRLDNIVKHYQDDYRDCFVGNVHLPGAVDTEVAIQLQMRPVSQEGVDFSKHLYVPEVDITTGKIHHEREDHNHILKRIAKHTRDAGHDAINVRRFDEAMLPDKTDLGHAALVGLRKQSRVSKPMGDSMQGAVDDYSRTCVYLSASGHNTGARTLSMFLRGAVENGLPSRIRTDRGSEDNENSANPAVVVTWDQRLPTFSGKDPFEEWLEDVDRTLNSWSTPSSQRANLILRHLQGDAKQEVACLTTRKKTDVNALLSEAYRDPAAVTVSRLP